MKLIFDNSISVNVDGSLCDSTQQQYKLRQGDYISSTPFNHVVKPFLLSILNNKIIGGYYLKARKSQR